MSDPLGLYPIEPWQLRRLLWRTDHIRPLVNFSTDHAKAGALREATAEEGAGAGVGDHNAVVRRQELYTRAAK